MCKKRNPPDPIGRYFLHKPALARVVTLNPESKASGILTVDGFTDSDWAGCVDTRRSSDCSVVIVGGSVVIAHQQTQPASPLFLLAKPRHDL